MTKTEKEIQDLLKDKAFLVHSIKDWQKLLLSLSPYCNIYDYGSDYVSGRETFVPLYLRITGSYRKEKLDTGWGKVSDSVFYSHCTTVKDLNLWFNIL